MKRKNYSEELKVKKKTENLEIMCRIDEEYINFIENRKSNVLNLHNKSMVFIKNSVLTMGSTKENIGDYKSCRKPLFA